MARYLPHLGAPKAAELEAAWRKHTASWARQRLLVLRLVAQHELNAEQIAQAAGAARSTVFRYLDLFLAGGVAGLLTRQHAGGKTPVIKPKWQEELAAGLRAGQWRRARDVQAWLKAKGGTLSLSTIYYWLKKAGGVLKVPRKAHAKKDAAAVAQFRLRLAARLTELGAGADRVRLWVARRAPVRPVAGHPLRLGAAWRPHSCDPRDASPVGLRLRGPRGRWPPRGRGAVCAGSR